MNDPLQDERISAYLDGEMTVEERAEFEQQLAADPERRRLLEELRALSATLGGLPKEMLGNSFSDQVLRKAERSVLTQSAAVEKTHERDYEPVLPIGYSRRGWVWASLAVAAALILMIRLQDQDPLGPKLAKRQPVLEEAATKAVDKLPAAMDAEPERDDLVRNEASSSLDSDERVAEEEGLARRLSGRLRESAVAESPVAESSIASPVAAISQVMVVHLDMRADAADQSRLNQVLVSNGIACDVKAQYGVPAYRLADRDQRGGRKALPGEDGDHSKKLGAAPKAARGSGLGGGGFGGGGGTAAKKGTSEDVVYEDVVYVEASYSQIAQTLQQLHDNVRDFPAVEVDPAPDVLAQQAFIGNSRGRASNRWARATDDRSEKSGETAKLRAEKNNLGKQDSPGEGVTPLDVQLQSMFADQHSADVSGEDLAQAVRVPARQRKVAEQIVLGNRAYNLKNKNELETSDGEGRLPQQKPSGARSWYRSDDRVYVLFVLNIVEALGGEASKSATIEPSAAAKTIEPQRTPRNTEKK